MARLVVAAGVGGLFGAGLVVSGMTDTRKVQGFLDLFGAWDPTLAFVLGGALIPMALAWRWSATRRPVFAAAFPSAPRPRLDRGLVLGSMLFGAGWGLTGLCPGPSLAALSFGGGALALFVAAMGLGMLAAAKLKGRLDAPAAAQ